MTTTKKFSLPLTHHRAEVRHGFEYNICIIGGNLQRWSGKKGWYALCETIVPSGKRFRAPSVSARSEYIDSLATM